MVQHILQAQKTKKPYIKIKNTKKNLICLNELSKNGIITHYLRTLDYITIYLNYSNNDNVLKAVKYISTRSRHCYIRKSSLKKLIKKNKSSVFALNTITGFKVISNSSTISAGGQLYFKLN